MPRRAAALAFAARFTDEALSGAWSVLTPTFRQVFRLSLVQVGLLTQVLTWVALIVEPPTAGMIDVRPRRPLMAFGACAVGGSVMVMAGAPSYGVLLVAFALYGLGSGPLALTADVVVIDAFPSAPERAFTRSTFFDTIGALLGPAIVASAAAAGVSWRVVLASLGAVTVLYAVALAGTTFPGPSRSDTRGRALARQLLGNVRAVVRDRTTRRPLVLLLCFDLFEAAFVLKFIWLHESVGLSQPLVAVYAAAEQVVDLVALRLLDHWLSSVDAVRILRRAAVALVVLPAMWVGVPGVAGRIAVGVPLAFAYALIWPVAKSRSLTAAPELAGATQAVSALFPVIPLAIGEAWLAQVIGIGPAMALTAGAGAGLICLATRE